MTMVVAEMEQLQYVGSYCTCVTSVTHIQLPSHLLQLLHWCHESCHEQMILNNSNCLQAALKKSSTDMHKNQYSVRNHRALNAFLG